MLSVDNYVPAVYNRFYNQKEQGNVADYVIIMGYDEHYAGGEAGSVSSIGYVENGIKDMLFLVPKEKVINAVPFYTRLWTGSGDNASSRAMGISEATKWVSESGMDLTWDDSAGQYYGRGGRPNRGKHSRGFWTARTANSSSGWRRQGLWDSRWI